MASGRHPFKPVACNLVIRFRAILNSGRSNRECDLYVIREEPWIEDHVERRLDRVATKNPVVHVPIFLEPKATLGGAERIEIHPRIPMQNFSDHLGTLFVVYCLCRRVVRESPPRETVFGIERKEARFPAITGDDVVEALLNPTRITKSKANRGVDSLIRTIGPTQIGRKFGQCQYLLSPRLRKYNGSQRKVY
jgi:hypothetical protein